MVASGRRRILTIFGTRPEAIKLAPVIKEIQTSATLESVVAVTGQHREMLDQVNDLFGIIPDADLDIISAGQTLTEVTTRALTGLQGILERMAPQAVLVQGDTTTTFSGALAAFYNRIPVVHLEAGLRTHDVAAPFPEELNRRLTSRLTSLHLAATPRSRDHLLAEGVGQDSIVVTGNTVIDALLSTVRLCVPFDDPRLDRLASDPRRMLLVTAHRRESWGQPMRAIARAVRRIAETLPDIVVVMPMHKNPVVRADLEPELRAVSNVLLTEPASYGAFCRLLSGAHVVLTDSGGVQEEAPSLGKPVVVMRDTTERPEAVEAGTATLVGRDEDGIVTTVTALFCDDERYARMANAVNPYGDGRAARRAVQAIEHYFGAGPRPQEFSP